MKNKKTRNILINVSFFAIMIITYIWTDGRQLIPFSDRLNLPLWLVLLLCSLVLIFNYIKSTRVLIVKKAYIGLIITSVGTLLLLLCFAFSLYRFYK